MRLATRGGVKWYERQSFRAFRLRKRVHQFLRFRPGCDKTVVLIVGCQRSGTSMLSHVFRRDLDVVTFDEVSPLSSACPEGLRLDPLGKVVPMVLAERSPLVVLKPLVESQDLRRLFDALPAAKAIWIYRNYTDVADSNVRMFGPRTGHSDLAPIIAGSEDSWRSEHVSQATRDSIRQVYSAALSPHDAAALFWYARNSLYFEQRDGLGASLALCRYEDIRSEPDRVMSALYGFVGRRYPGPNLVRDVIAERRPGLDSPVRFDADVEALCAGLLGRLDEVMEKAGDSPIAVRREADPETGP